MWRKGNTSTLLVVQPVWKTIWSFLKKLKIKLLYDQAIPLLGTYAEKMKTLPQKDTCTPMFIVALYTITKTWKQPKGPSTDEWFQKIWCVYIYIYTTHTYIYTHTHIHTQWNITQP